MATITITNSDITGYYSNNLLRQMTDDDKSGTIDTGIIDACIVKATDKLDELLDGSYGRDSDYYGTTRLQGWLKDLTYYFLCARVEKEKVAQDKLQSVKDSIAEYSENTLPSVAASLSTVTGVSSHGRFYSEDDFLIPFDDVKDWY